MAKLQMAKAVQDSDSHWYVIPEYEFVTFCEMENDGERDEWAVFNERFEQYRTGGDLNLVQLWAEL